VSAASPDSEALLEQAETCRVAFERAGQLPLLRRATSLALRAVRVADGDTARGRALVSYAANLHWLMHLTNREAILDVAERRYSQAYDLLAEDPTAQAVALGNLLQLARQRFERTSQVTVLVDAITRAEDYLAQPVVDPQRRIMVQYQQGVLWRFRFHAEDEVSHLDRAVVLLRQARQDNTDPRYAAAIANALAAALADQYSYRRETVWLDEAVAMLLLAANRLADDDPDRAMLANNLANFHSERFEACGEPADLHDVVRWAEAAVHAGAGTADETRYRRTLGNFLVLRFRETGVLADLEAAVTELDQALTLAPSKSDAAAMALDSLAVAHDLLGRTTGSVADRDRSMVASRDAVARTPQRFTSYRVRLNNLCQGLGDEAVACGDLSLIDEAISRHDRMLTDLADNFGATAELRLGAANLRVNRSRISGASADAVAATRLCGEVAAEASASLHAQVLVTRARALTQWRHFAPHQAVAVAMRAAWRRATAVCTATSPRRGFDAAIQWLRHSVESRQWADGMDAARSAVAALDVLVVSQHSRKERLDWLRLGADLAPLAAESALGCDRPDLAAELAHRAHASLLALATDRHLDRTAEPGWHESVLACAATEPVVLVTPGHWSGIAIVITGAAGRRRTTTVPLPAVTIDAVEEQAERLHQRTPTTRTGDIATKALHGGLLRYGLWAGQHVFKPLLDSLPSTAFGLVALGTLGGLPHTAAWWFDLRRGAPVALHQAVRVRLLPRVSPRYAAATATAWSSGRIPRSVTLVGSAEPNVSVDLTGAEARVLRAWTDNWTEQLSLDGPVEGQPGTVQSAADILHATGHSTVDSTGGGSLTPPGGPAVSLHRVREILEQRLTTPPRLVLWSSCRTALRDARVPGEHLGLSGIALELGCTGVVATSLPVPDASAFLFTTRFLHHVRSGMPAAEAWQRAIGWLADSTPERILTWLMEIGEAIGVTTDTEVVRLIAWLRAQQPDAPPSPLRSTGRNCATSAGPDGLSRMPG
jgi:tetratricopeptide (TPR) repeat protein